MMSMSRWMTLLCGGITVIGGTLAGIFATPEFSAVLVPGFILIFMSAFMDNS